MGKSELNEDLMEEIISWMPVDKNCKHPLVDEFKLCLTYEDGWIKISTDRFPKMYGAYVNIWYQVPDRHYQDAADLLDFRVFHSTIKQRYKTDYITRAIYREIRDGDDPIYFQCYRKLIWKCVLNDERRKHREEWIRSLEHNRTSR